MPPLDADWAPWFRKHGRTLVLFARQWVPDPGEAEDAVQDGFVRFWRSREGVLAPVAYLYSCVKHCALDTQRSSSRRRRREEVAARARPSGDAAWFDLEAERQERAAAIEAALRTLPAEQREVLVMRIWGELSFPEIGEALEISPNTAASRCRYALLRLKGLLSEEIGHER